MIQTRMKQKIKEILIGYVVENVGETSPKIDPDCINSISDDIFEMIQKARLEQKYLEDLLEQLDSEIAAGRRFLNRDK